MKNKGPFGLVVFYLCAVLFCSSASGIRMYEIIDLCEGEDRPDIHVEAINDHGQVVGTHNCQAFVWDVEDGFRYLADEERSAWDINNNGDVVVSKWIGSVTLPQCPMINYGGVKDVAFDIFDSSGGSEPVGSVHMRDRGEFVNLYHVIRIREIGIGINDEKDVVWGSSFSSINLPEGHPRVRGIFWNAEDFYTQLIGLGGEGVATRAYDINNSRQIAGNYGTEYEGLWEGFGRACVWDFDGKSFECRKLESPEDSYSNARAINDYGETVGFVGHEGTDEIPGLDVKVGAFWDSERRLSELGTLGGDSSEAIALNGNREIVGWSYMDPELIRGGGRVKEAFIWTEQTGMFALQKLFVNDSKWERLNEAVDINESGVIIGRGFRADGNVSAFLMRPLGDGEGITGIRIFGDDTVLSGTNSRYRVEGYYEKGISLPLVEGVEWAVESDIATIDQVGVLSSSPSDESHTVKLFAKYSEGDVLMEASKTITVRGPKKLLVPSEYSTIQAGICDALEGDTILVADGVYIGLGNRDIDFLGKGITVVSENGPGNCIIDCGGTTEELHRGFLFHKGEGKDSVLEGFTIRGGYLNTGSMPFNPISNVMLSIHFQGVGGGGIACIESSPVIRNCVITANTRTSEYQGFQVPSRFDDGGAGIYLSNSSACIEGCVITANVCEFKGGGVFVAEQRDLNSIAIIRNCVVTGNDGLYGGGIYSVGNVVIENCIVSGNRSLQGGGVFCNGGTRIVHSVIVGNWADEHGGGIYSQDRRITLRVDESDIDLEEDENRVKVVNTIIRGNRAPEGEQIAFAGVYHNPLLRPVQPVISLSNNPVSVKSMPAPQVIEMQTMPLSGKLQIRALLERKVIPNEDMLKRVEELRVSLGALGGVSYMILLEVLGCDVEGGRDGVWFMEFGEDVEIDWDRVFVWGDGNVDADPGFVGDGYWDDYGTVDDPNDDYWVDGDYRLRCGSVCIDGGVECDVEFDIAGNARGFDFPMVDNGVGGSVWDIGAYEAVVSEEVDFRIMPRSINRRSGRRELMGIVSGASGFMEDVGLLLLPGGIESRRVYSIEASKRGGEKHLFAFFDSGKVLESIENSGKVELGVVGMNGGGEYFYGSDTVHITGQGKGVGREKGVNRRKGRSRGL